MANAKNSTGSIHIPAVEPTKAFHKGALEDGDKNVANVYVRMDHLEAPEGKTLKGFDVTPVWE